ncbi:ATP phosphoribosyltransferase [Alphaproteobacteria bacterium]|nr:ATP phosphoribosyltransferase [Alphaproteobacteria bacterium]
MADKKIILALPKGRILEELAPILKKCDIKPEDAFFDSNSRALRFNTNHDNLDIIRVRAFDVATFVAYGGAQMGIVGSDVLEEFQYNEVYAPVDLKIGKCRLSVAMLKAEAKTEKPEEWSHIKIATKYPNLTTQYFARRGVQAECIKLNGAMEIAPTLGLVNRIVDLVSTGSTLKANNLVEIETILNISSKFIVNRTAMKTNETIREEWAQKFQNAALQ